MMISAITLSNNNTHLLTPFLPFIAKMAPSNGNKNMEIIAILPNDSKEKPFIIKENNTINIPKQMVERTL